MDECLYKLYIDSSAFLFHQMSSGYLSLSSHSNRFELLVLKKEQENVSEELLSNLETFLRVKALRLN